jgi:hypothetical protein
VDLPAGPQDSVGGLPIADCGLRIVRKEPVGGLRRLGSDSNLPPNECLRKYLQLPLPTPLGAAIIYASSASACLLLIADCRFRHEEVSTICYLNSSTPSNSSLPQQSTRQFASTLDVCNLSLAKAWPLLQV